MAESSTVVTIALVLREQIATLRVLIKTSARTWLLLSPAIAGGRNWLVLLACAGTAADVTLAMRSRRGLDDSRFAAVLDIIEVVLWSALVPPLRPQSAAVVLAAPTLLLAPIRSGTARASALAGAVVIASGLARYPSGGEPNFLDSLIYVSIPVASGTAVLRLLVAELHAQRTHAAAAASAESRAAELLGRNETIVGVGADRIDELQVSILRLSGLGSDAAALLRLSVGRHKAEIAERTRAEGAYLWDTLLEHAMTVRAHQPAVTRHVFYDVPARARTVVLTKRQQTELLLGLDSAGLTGVQTVDVTEEAQQLSVRVGSTRVALRATPLARFRLSALPAAFVAMALMIMTMSNPAYSATPMGVTVPAVLASLGMGYLLHRRIRSAGSVSSAAHITAGLFVFGLTALGVVVFTPPYRGVVLIGALVGLAFVLGVVPNGARPRLWATVGLVVAAVAAVAAAPGLDARTIAAELIWPASAFAGAIAVSSALTRLETVIAAAEATTHIEQRDKYRRRAARDEAEYLLRLTDEGAELARQAAASPERDTVLADLVRLRTSIAAMMPS